MSGVQVASEDPIMIGGCGSSGTTLLAHLLNAHPSVFCGPELYLLNKRILYKDERAFSELQYRLHEFRNNCERLPTSSVLDLDVRPSSTCVHPRSCSTVFLRDIQKYDLDEERLSDIAARSMSFRELVDAIFQTVLHRVGKNRWAEKTPTNCYCIGEFLTLYPNGRYIHMIRDGRDVVLSLLKRGSSPEAAVRRWIHDTAISFSHKGRDRYYELKYEDLVGNPEQTLTKLMTFLRLEGCAQTLLSQAQERQLLETTHASWNTQPHEPISTRSVGKWKQSRTDDTKYLEQLFRYTSLTQDASTAMALERSYNACDLLLECGYDPSDAWDPEPRYGSRILAHFLSENACQRISRRRMYCRISHRTTSNK
jgi:hypothetical protein